MINNKEPDYLFKEKKQFQRKLMFRIVRAVMIAVCMFALIGGFAPKSVEAKTYKIKNKKQLSQIPEHKGGTFKLTKDIKLGPYDFAFYLTDADKGAGGKFVIDFNGHQIKGSNYILFNIESKSSTVIFKDSKASKKKVNVLNTADAVGSGTLFDLENGRITFESGIYQTKGANSYVLRLDNGFSDAAIVNIKGGTFKSEKDNTIFCHTGGKLTIKGGTFISGGNTADNGSALLYYGNSPGSKDVRLTNGTFKSKKGKWAIIARPYEWKVNEKDRSFANSLLYKGKYAKNYSLKRDENGRVIFGSKTVKVKKK